MGLHCIGSFGLSPYTTSSSEEVGFLPKKEKVKMVFYLLELLEKKEKEK